MSDVRIKIVLDDAHLGATEEVGGKLAARGLTVEDTIPEIGVILGTADSARLEDLRCVEGVLDASQEGVVQLPDPDGDAPQ